MSYDEMVANIPSEIKTEVDLSYAIASQLDRLIKENGL